MNDETVTWRVIHRIDPDAVLVCDVFPKKTEKIPRRIIDACRRRLAMYDRNAR